MAKQKINTEGGSYVRRNVDTGGGNFVGRDINTNNSHNIYHQQRLDTIFSKINSYHKALSTTITIISILTLIGAILFSNYGYKGFVESFTFIPRFIISFMVLATLLMTLIYKPLQKWVKHSMKRYILSLDLDKATAVELKDRIGITKWNREDVMKEIEKVFAAIA